MFTVRVGEPDVIYRTFWPESTGESSGRPKVFALQIEANATLVKTQKDSMLLPTFRSTFRSEG